MQVEEKNDMPRPELGAFAGGLFIFLFFVVYGLAGGLFGYDLIKHFPDYKEIYDLYGENDAWNFIWSFQGGFDVVFFGWLTVNIFVFCPVLHHINSVAFWKLSKITRLDIFYKLSTVIFFFWFGLAAYGSYSSEKQSREHADKDINGRYYVKLPPYFYTDYPPFTGMNAKYRTKETAQ